MIRSYHWEGHRRNGLRSILSLVGLFDRAVMTRVDGSQTRATEGCAKGPIVQPQLLALTSAHL
jgi:hypothetical protein